MRHQPAGALLSKYNPPITHPLTSHLNEKTYVFIFPRVIIMEKVPIIIKIILISTALEYASSSIVALAHEDSTLFPIALD